MHDNLERSYILYVPASYDAANPVPLVFNFHGYGSNASQQIFYGDFRPIADQEGFLVVHPDGTRDQANTTHFNVGWGGSTVDDVGFTNALLDVLAAEYSINMDRVYSTGMSNGGFMSYLLACELSDRIAAVASVTGSMTTNLTQTCDSDRPMPVLEIHGTNDATVPYDGAAFAEGIDDVIAYWVDFNDCDTEPAIENIEDTNTSDGSTVEHHVYANGTDGVQTELFKIIGGGHTWPGSAFDLGGTNYDINASAEVWRFFNRYDINGLRNTTSASSLNLEQKIAVFPNPITDTVNLKFEEEGTKNYALYSVHGVLLKSGIFNTKDAALDFAQFPLGQYLLKVDHSVVKLIKL